MGMNVLPGQLVWRGRHVDPAQDLDEPVTYSVDWPAILSGASAPNGKIVIQGDRDFICESITHQQGDAVQLLTLRVQITRPDGRAFFNEPTYINAVSSQNAGLPAFLPMPVVLRRTATYVVSFSAD